jgi:hypothetical protein
MTKGSFILSVVLVCFGVSIYSASTAVSKTDISTVANNEIPDSINLILTRSCTPCHSGSNIMASSHFDLNKWTEYTPAAQAKKGAAICNEITKGDMPPKAARKSKPELIPTDQQTTLICKWTKSLIAN